MPLLTALISVTVLLIARMSENTLIGLKTDSNWLQAQHSFSGKDGDPIQCTCWQFVGYNVAAAVVAVLLSIKY